MDAALQLGTAEMVLPEDMPLLLTAALLHDIGFTKTVKNHEEKAVKLQKEYCLIMGMMLLPLKLFAN